VNETTNEERAALNAYWNAQTLAEQRAAYGWLRAIGFPPRYGEPESLAQTVWRKIRRRCFRAIGV
jgi:hypothetical protein